MRFLIVDDEPEILLLVQANLRPLGHECLVAETAGDALAVCQEQRPDVLLLDVAMPGIDGPELLAGLRRQGLVPPQVVLVSAIPPHDLAELADRLGVAHLSKPFSAATFRTLLDDLIANATA
jgi:CheY-like chemotaxis protein